MPQPVDARACNLAVEINVLQAVQTGHLLHVLVQQLTRINADVQAGEVWQRREVSQRERRELNLLQLQVAQLPEGSHTLQQPICLPVVILHVHTQLEGINLRQRCSDGLKAGDARRLISSNRQLGQALQ